MKTCGGLICACIFTHFLYVGKLLFPKASQESLKIVWLRFRKFNSKYIESIKIAHLGCTVQTLHTGNKGQNSGGDTPTPSQSLSRRVYSYNLVGQILKIF